jgi:hypothetical protein
MQTEFERTQSLSDGHRPTAEELDPIAIGRFRVIRRLGAGGMGEVYLCRDDALDRKIAVKRVRGGPSEALHQHLRREARALAKFSHDNIVQVHEIGEHEGGSFIAMELVEGETLGEWLWAAARPWTEICDRFMAAGRGLAAAHAQGIVHRDFKPDNVLVRREDARVKVADFGLVLDQSVDGRERAERIVGTPKYMAPEQLRGEHADARSDQFSFCLALYEAVWGRLPFADARLHERLAAIDAGDIVVPPGHRALFRVVRRGLEGDPGRRWPSMDALLLALARVRQAPSRRRRWAVATFGVAALVGGSWLVRDMIAAPPLRCEASLDGIWDDSTRTRVEHHLDTLSAKHAAASRERLLAALDRWASAWTSEYAGLCERIADTRELSTAQHGSIQSACLMRQRADVGELVEAVAQGSADTLARALVAVAGLPRPDDCAREQAALAVEPPPPMLASDVELLRRELTVVHTERMLGRFDDARARVDTVITAAVELDYPPLEAEARAELAKIEREHGDGWRGAALYDEAIHLAQACHHDQLAAELLLERVEVSLYQLPGDHSVGLRLEQAGTALARANASDALRARWSFAAGRLAMAEQDHALARQRYTEALALAGDDAIERPYYLSALALVTASQAERLELRQRALELAREQFGPAHPRTALPLYNHALELQAAGREVDAQAELQQADDIWRDSLAPDHKLRAKLEQDFALAALTRGELDLAERHALEAARIIDARSPANDPERGEPAFILAEVAAIRADVEPDPDIRQTLRNRAVFHATRATRLFEANQQAGLDTRLAQLYQLLGNQQMSLGDLTAADASFERAAASTEAPGMAAITAVRRAELALRAGELADAALQLDLAERDLDALGPERVSYALLRALVDLRLDQLGKPRLAELRALRDAYPDIDPALPGWLDELGVDADERVQLGF